MWSSVELLNYSIFIRSHDQIIISNSPPIMLDTFQVKEAWSVTERIKLERYPGPWYENSEWGNFKGPVSLMTRLFMVCGKESDECVFNLGSVILAWPIGLENGAYINHRPRLKTECNSSLKERLIARHSVSHQLRYPSLSLVKGLGEVRSSSVLTWIMLQASLACQTLLSKQKNESQLYCRNIPVTSSTTTPPKDLEIFDETKKKESASGAGYELTTIRSVHQNPTYLATAVIAANILYPVNTTPHIWTNPGSLTITYTQPYPACSLKYSNSLLYQISAPKGDWHLEIYSYIIIASTLSSNIFTPFFSINDKEFLDKCGGYSLTWWATPILQLFHCPGWEITELLFIPLLGWLASIVWWVLLQKKGWILYSLRGFQDEIWYKLERYFFQLERC